MSDRPSPRIDIRLTGVLTAEGGSGTRAVSVNLSETGMLVRASRLHARGTSVELEFAEFKAGGEVIWNREVPEGNLVGIKFGSLGWRDKRKIRELVALAEE